MERFKTILFSPLGQTGNPAALRRVADLADRNGARLTLLDVVDEPTRWQRVTHRAHYYDQVLTAERDRRRGRLEGWAAECGIESAEIGVEVGTAALSIVGWALAEGDDLVVVTSDEDREDHATIKRLLRKCPSPVWVVRPTRARIQRVLAAVNPDPEELELNRTILELASSMVELYGGELHVVHAWELYGESTMRSSAFLRIPEEEVDALAAEERAGHEAALDELLTDTGVADAPWEVHVVKGPAASVVPHLVDRARINLLVMGTVARTGLSGLVMGNTAERVLDEVRCSVMAVKPPGFISPLANGHD